MKCEANGCTAALEPKSLPGSAGGGPSPWVVYDILPGWCVRQVANTDSGGTRAVVLCPVHSAGIVKPADPYATGAESLDADGTWADPRLEIARLRSVIEAGVKTSSRLAARNIELAGEVARLKEQLEQAEAWPARPPTVTR